MKKNAFRTFPVKEGIYMTGILLTCLLNSEKKITHVLSEPCYLLYFLNKIGLLY